ncbi:MAG: hypothetical protein K9G48_15600 [Reyranella sp.]|nr:hypothetical protein [Reyranella sp.]
MADARHAQNEMTTALLEVVDHGGERLQRRDMRQAVAALADEVDGGARQEHRDPEAGGEAAVGDGEGDRGSSESMPLMATIASLSVPDWIG